MQKTDMQILACMLTESLGGEKQRKQRKLHVRNCRDPFPLYFLYHLPGVKDSSFSLSSRAFLLANYAKF